MDFSIELDTVRRTLDAPRIHGFALALKQSVAEWNSLGGARLVRLGKGTRGMFINDYWYSYAKEALSNDLGVMLKENWDRTYFNIDYKLIIRLKHVDDNYRPRNHRTSRAQAWERQEAFADILPLPRVDLCYQLDLTGSMIKDAMLQFSYGDIPQWRFQIWGQPHHVFSTNTHNMLGRKVFDYADFSVIV